jgi:hypothetical protein
MLETHQSDKLATTGRRIADFPGLASLGLSAEELDALVCQGFVCGERRRAKTYYKLRFRLRGKQRVHYIGSAELATAVSQELAALQDNIRSRRRRTKLYRAATQSLRRAKQVLEPHLHARGLYYHGQLIRKRRTPKAGV